ncbi:MAG: SHOCT domain-containing protein [Acidimicrobiales bacterium]
MGIFGRSSSSISFGRHLGFFFGPGPGRSFGPFPAILALLLLIVVIVLAVAFIRYERNRHRWGLVGPSGTPASFEALRILNERFAKGEIDPEDYKVRRDLLQGST